MPADDGANGNAEAHKLEPSVREYERQFGRQTLEVKILRDALATDLPACQSARERDLPMECAPVAGQGQAPALSRAGRLLSSQRAGLRKPSAEYRRRSLQTSSMKGRRPARA
ncbi:hypothetical protein LNKW23_43300 [Paralimibaculum aggregatum]|uniref:Uncharacterized protein n=1 Tax=Paralimibaculum aggregatum TaxID=3036245 RepID=A0ABQ6LSR7_9RHOB|nr:hypothetical protein LNKW23_43300 [Limibaculum sp. NKW23]